MNRRIGISILSVVSLTTGVLVAEHAFAPLRQPYSITNEALPSPPAESTASPTAPAPTAPTNQTQQAQPPVERRDASEEADGDPMMAAIQPVIEAVWQNVAAPVASDVRVSWASTRELVGRAPEARATPIYGIASIGLGGVFLGTQRAGAAASQGTSLTAPTAAATGDTPSTGVAPEETLAMNDVPGSPVPEDLDDSTAPLSEDTRTEPQTESLTPTELVASLPEDFNQPLPPVTVPEPLPTSLFIFGVLLGVLSRRRRLAA
jgi:hypothetical protein